MHRRTLLTFIGLSTLIPFKAFAADKSGSFSGRGNYKVKGSVKLEGKTITLGSNFSSSRGPGLHIYVGNGSPSKIVAKLKSRRGAQTYKLPSSIDPDSVSSVHVYCKPFSVEMGRANLK